MLLSEEGEIARQLPQAVTWKGLTVQHDWKRLRDGRRRGMGGRSGLTDLVVCLAVVRRSVGLIPSLRIWTIHKRQNRTVLGVRTSNTVNSSSTNAAQSSSIWVAVMVASARYGQQRFQRPCAGKVTTSPQQLATYFGRSVRWSLVSRDGGTDVTKRKKDCWKIEIWTCSSRIRSGYDRHVTQHDDNGYCDFDKLPRRERDPFKRAWPLSRVR